MIIILLTLIFPPHSCHMRDENILTLRGCQKAECLAFPGWSPQARIPCVTLPKRIFIRYSISHNLLTNATERPVPNHLSDVARSLDLKHLL